MNTLNRTLNFTLAIALLSLATGCGGMPPTHQFMLTAAPDAPRTAQPQLVIQAVELPAYLSEPGIALATAPHEVLHAQYHRWAEPLAEGIRRLLRTELERGFSEQLVQGKLALTIYHFHGAANGRVVLDADWRIAGDKATRSGRFFAETRQATDGYPALVATQAQLVRGLAGNIVKALKPDRLATAAVQ